VHELLSVQLQRARDDQRELLGPIVPPSADEPHAAIRGSASSDTRHTLSALVGNENARSIWSRRSNLARFQTEVLQSLGGEWAINYNRYSCSQVCRVTDGDHRFSRI